MLLGVAIYKFFPYGGLQRDLLKIARECLTRGHRVRVYAQEWRGPPIEGVDLRVLPVRGLASHRRYARFHRRLAEEVAREPVDLLLGMNKMPGLDAYFAGDSCYVEKVATQRPRAYRLLPRYRHFAAFEASVFRAGARAHVLTLTPATQCVYARRYGTPPERFHLLPPGIERDRIAPPDAHRVRAAFRQEHGLDHEDRLLLFIGSGFRKKGLDRVLTGVAALPPALAEQTRLYVLGEDNAAPFRRQARRLGLDGRVRFYPGRDDVPAFLLGADALLLPAYDELAGMVILEAMGAGLAALVSAECGYAAYLADADAGLVTPAPFRQADFDALLGDVLTSPRRAEWRANGLAAARDGRLFGLETAAVDCLERLVGERDS
ncbi:MAG: glycosyltransferase family 4 protein [Myxococcales bacterium]